MKNPEKGKVTGLGGVFFKSKDPEMLKKWYENHLGLPCDQHGHMFEWFKTDEPDKKGFTQFSIFNADTNYMEPSGKEFMINFRVDDVAMMVERLKNDGMKVIGDIETYSYGKFAWVLDPDGNKIELWEPTDEAFE
jgi:predicted enzyme related to lactoylglutathione lyase